MARRWKVVWSVISVVGLIIGLGGIPDDLAKWAKWIAWVKGHDIWTAELLGNTRRWIVFGIAVAWFLYVNDVHKKLYGRLSGLVIFGNPSTGSQDFIWRQWVGQTKQPQLRILFRYDMPWVQHQMGMQEPGRQIAHSGSLFTYRLAVVNHACDLAEKVIVEMIWIDPQLATHRLVPCRLHFRHNNTLPYAQDMDIARTNDPQYQDALFVDVFWFWTSPHKELLGIWSSVAGVGQEIPVQSYKFAVKVSSKNCGAPITKEFRFIHKRDGAPTSEPEET